MSWSLKGMVAARPALPCPALPCLALSCPALPCLPALLMELCTCRHSSGSIAKLTRRLTSMSEGHSMEVDAAQPQPVPQSDALIDGFTVPEVRYQPHLPFIICVHHPCPG